MGGNQFTYGVQSTAWGRGWSIECSNGERLVFVRFFKYFFIFKSRSSNSLGTRVCDQYNLILCFPQLCQVAGYPMGGGPFLIHMGNCWAWNTQQRCSSWHKLVHLAPTTIPNSKALKYLYLANSPSEWHTHTIHVSILSRLTNPSLTRPFRFLYTDWSGCNKWHQ
jgi:hypothetical protein